MQIRTFPLKIFRIFWARRTGNASANWLVEKIHENTFALIGGFRYFRIEMFKKTSGNEADRGPTFIDGSRRLLTKDKVGSFAYWAGCLLMNWKYPRAPLVTLNVSVRNESQLLAMLIVSIRLSPPCKDPFRWITAAGPVSMNSGHRDPFGRNWKSAPALWYGARNARSFQSIDSRNYNQSNLFLLHFFKKKNYFKIFQKIKRQADQ